MKTKRSNSSTITGSSVAGRSATDFALEAGIGRSTIYTLPADCWPEHVRIGNRIVIVETPAAWLARMRALGGVKMVRKAKATETAGQPA